jgi:hypothetical protein
MNLMGFRPFREIYGAWKRRKVCFYLKRQNAEQPEWRREYREAWYIVHYVKTCPCGNTVTYPTLYCGACGRQVFEIFFRAV